MTDSTAALSRDVRPDVLRALRARPRAVLELGCGSTKRDPDAVGVDVIPAPGVDVVCDAIDALRGLPDESVDHIFSSHFLEHVDDLDVLMRESERVLRTGGVFEAVVPHHANAYYYSDPTHRTFFGLYTMSYFAHDGVFHRRVPGYARRPRLRIERVDLTFKSERPFYGRYLIGRVWQAIFGTTRYMKELYEERYSGSIPCYELRYVLVRTSAEASKP